MTTKESKKKGMIVVYPDKCVACRTCELQCAVEHSKSKDLSKAVKEQPLSIPGIKVESTGEFVVPLQCRHCEDAPCVRICPNKSMTRPESNGPVLVNKDTCTGCELCILVCPFGVIKKEKGRKVVTKCDLCIERLEKGELPACVVGCPTKAIKFESLEDSAAGKKKDYLVQFKRGKK